MAPKAEVFIPNGQEAALRKAVIDLGGTILSTKADERWTPHDLNPRKLISFIRETEPSLKIPKRSYESIFASLRLLKAQRQEEILTKFYRERVIGLPNAEEVARFLVRLNTLPPFRPNNEISTTDLQNLVNQYRDKLAEKRHLEKQSLPVEIVRGNLGPQTTLFNMDPRILSELPFSLRESVRAAVAKPETNERSLKRARAIFVRAALFMASSLTETSYQLTLGKNTELQQGFHEMELPLIAIYRAGACPVGESKGQFIVFIPQPLQK